MALEVTRDAGDQQQFDALAIRNKKPGFHYRWARKTDMAIATHEFHGYEIVNSGEDDVTSVLSSRTRMKKATDVDGSVTLGDMILLRIPQAEYDRRLAAEASLCKRREQAVKGAFKEAVRKAVPNSHKPDDRTIEFEERDTETGGNTSYNEGHTEVMQAIEEDRRRSET